MTLFYFTFLLDTSNPFSSLLLFFHLLGSNGEFKQALTLKLKSQGSNVEGFKPRQRGTCIISSSYSQVNYS